MKLAARYPAKESEEKWYSYWMEQKYFASKPDDREAFTVVIPPPNVTGILHMGHMLNNTIQDILIRKANRPRLYCYRSKSRAKTPSARHQKRRPY